MKTTPTRALAASTRPAFDSYKLGVPRVVDHVRRHALLDRLAQSQRSAPITWVVGLPGSGKTSLVARWVEESRAPVAWYRLYADDTDGASWISALVDVLGGSRPSLPSWSPENGVDLLDFGRSFFAELARAPLLLVLDDCHRVADDAGILELLATLPEVCGGHLRAILISRRPPPPALAHGVLSGWLQVVDDLRLSEAEAAQVAQKTSGGEARPEQKRLLAEADGWLAYVLALCRRPSSVVLSPGDRSTRVGDFLAAELLASVPKEDRAGLRRLAELPEIPTEGGAAALLSPEVGRLLATLASQRYFVELLGGRYRLHDLLRDALLRLNLAEEGVDFLRRVRRDLAGWIADTMPEAAIQLRSSALDTRGVLGLLERHAPAWFARGLHGNVAAWLSGLPEPAEVKDRAALAWFRAQAQLPLLPEAARPLFAAARRLALEAGDAERAYVSWCGEVESYVIQWGDVHGLAALVDELELIQARLGAPGEALGFRINAAALTALMYGRAEDPRIERFAESTARAVVHAPDAGARISAAAQLLIYKMWWAGDFPGGRAIYDTFDAEVAAGGDLDALPRLLWWSCASIVDWQCGRPEECYRKVDRGLTLAASSGVHVRDFFLLTQGIFCALSQEDWPRAEAYLARLARTERQHKRLDVMVHHFFRSWYSLCRGDARTALAHAENAWPVAEAIGSMFHKVIVLSALAPARVHAGDLDGAEQAYRAQLALAKSARNHTFSFIAFCAGAEIALARRDEAALAKQVERILTVKRLGGFHSTCGWRTPMMRELFAFALEKGILPDVARQWIRERRLAPPLRPVAGWPMPVVIEAGEGLRVLLDGAASASGGGKSSKKLRELLAVLVAVKDGPSQEELADWLWPDADGDKAAGSLKVAVHRLRQWIGLEAVRVHDGRVSLDPALVDCDLWHLGASLDPDRVLRGFDAPPISALRAALRGG